MSEKKEPSLSLDVDLPFNAFFSKLHYSDDSSIWFLFIQKFVLLVASRDPLFLHFEVARRYLNDKENIQENEAIDILARKIVEHCFYISRLPSFRSQKICFANSSCSNEFFIDKDRKILTLDCEFVDYLRTLGHCGQEVAKEVELNSKKICAFFLSLQEKAPFRPLLWSLWVSESVSRNVVSPFLQIIAKVAWSRSCRSVWNRQTKQAPALAKTIVAQIKPILNPKEKKTFVQKEDNVVCVNSQGKPLMIAPTIDSEMIFLLQKGIQSLSTLTGHRLLRWQIKTGFEQWASGEPDFRVINIFGGYSHIAREAGCLSTKEIAKVKSILHTQAYGHFISNDNCQGNMIALRVLNRYKNHEPTKISITLGDMLLPGYVFSLGKKNRQLIPIGDLPPLHGSKNTHAQQAHLQLLVFEEFANQSHLLAQNGSVLISKEKWNELAFESGLGSHKIEAVVQHWCQPDLVRSFLDKQGDEYRLTSYYESAQKFLIFQGSQRLLNSRKGLASINKKRKSKSWTHNNSLKQK